MISSALSSIVLSFCLGRLILPARRLARVSTGMPHLPRPAFQTQKRRRDRSRGSARGTREEARTGPAARGPDARRLAAISCCCPSDSIARKSGRRFPRDAPNSASPDKNERRLDAHASMTPAIALSADSSASCADPLHAAIGSKLGGGAAISSRASPRRQSARCLESAS